MILTSQFWSLRLWHRESLKLLSDISNYKGSLKSGDGNLTGNIRAHNACFGWSKNWHSWRGIWVGFCCPALIICLFKKKIHNFLKSILTQLFYAQTWTDLSPLVKFPNYPRKTFKSKRNIYKPPPPPGCHPYSNLV